VTNGEVLRRVDVVQDISLTGQMKSRKLKYFGHVTRHDSLENDIMLGTMQGKRYGEAGKDTADVRRQSCSKV